MKRTVRGKDELVMAGKELVKKLAGLMPPPRVRLMEFHGLFVRCTPWDGERPTVAAIPAAPNAKLRTKVVPGGKEPARACKASSTSPSDALRATASDDKAKSSRDGTSGIDWTSPLKRPSRETAKFDVLACGRCGSRMKVLAVIEDQPVVEKLLRRMGLPHVPLPTSPARGQRTFDSFAA